MGDCTINGQPAKDARHCVALRHEFVSAVPEWAALMADNDLSRQDVRAILSRSAAAGGSVSFDDVVRRSSDPRLTFSKFQRLIADYGIDVYEEVEPASLRRGIEACLRGRDGLGDVWRWQLWNDPQFYTKAMAVNPARAFHRLSDAGKIALFTNEVLLYRFARDDWRILLDPIRPLPDYGAAADRVFARLLEQMPIVEEIQFPKDFQGAMDIFTTWLAQHGVTSPARMPRLEQIPALLAVTEHPTSAIQPLLIIVYPRLPSDHRAAAYDQTLRQLMDSGAFTVAYIEVGTPTELVTKLKGLTHNYQRPAHTLWIALPMAEGRNDDSGERYWAYRLNRHDVLRREGITGDVAEALARSASRQVVFEECLWRDRFGDAYSRRNALLCERFVPPHLRYVGPYLSSRIDDRSADSEGAIYSIAVDRGTRHITLEYDRGRTVVREAVPATPAKP